MISSNKENEFSKRKQDSQLAVEAAMAGRWREAVEINLKLIERYPEDVNACNRLGKAYFELGEYQQARNQYQRALELEPYNMIARKNMKRLVLLEEQQSDTGDEHDQVEPDSFIEETGKTAILEFPIANSSVYAGMTAGDKLKLEVTGTNLRVLGGHGTYLGGLKPKISQRLIRLMKGGNRYDARVVSITESSLKLIIREVYQHPALSRELSFPSRLTSRNHANRAAERSLLREQELDDERDEAGGFSIVISDDE